MYTPIMQADCLDRLMEVFLEQKETYHGTLLPDCSARGTPLLQPLHPHPRCILHRLRHMIRSNHLAARQNRNRPCQLQHPVIRPGRQMQLLHRCLE